MSGVPMADPIGFFLTWPTYGTWLPGDQRGWVEYHSGWQLPDPILQREAAALMTEDACRLDTAQRVLVNQTIIQHCGYRGWPLHAVNCRSNHVHVVVSAAVHPKTVQVQLKAWCTRRLRERELEELRADVRQTGLRKNWWAERGSRRWINDEDSLERAVLYVCEAQDY